MLAAVDDADQELAAELRGRAERLAGELGEGGR